MNCFRKRRGNKIVLECSCAKAFYCSNKCIEYNCIKSSIYGETMTRFEKEVVKGLNNIYYELGEIRGVID